jgi:hypothetical protein
MDNIEQRLAVLENWRIVVDVSLGKNEVNQEYIDKRFDSLENELKEIKKTAKNLNLTIWGAVLMLFVKFVASGGLAGVV